jgi:cytoplasmic iron level regulating protein YaaA (DUF328/UPF0246 family)
MIVIIPCGALKRKIKCQAQHLYIGSYFKSNLKWALSILEPNKILILSAKYGLIKLHEMISPYDLFMGDDGSVDIKTVSDQIDELQIRDKIIIALGGKNYLQCLRNAGLKIKAPVEGFGMGRQMHILKINKGRIPK